MYQVPKLDYAAPKIDRLPESGEARRAWYGIIVGLFLTLAVVTLWILSNIRIRSGPYKPSFVALVVGGAIEIAVVAIVAVNQHNRHRSRSFLIGSLIGLGMALLIEGLCYLKFFG